jgi:hypothetical protein
MAIFHGPFPMVRAEAIWVNFVACVLARGFKSRNGSRCALAVLFNDEPNSREQVGLDGV